jgi:sec-independent protein translocase protein TatA
LPKLGGAIGESIKNFKKGVKEDAPQLTDKNKEDDKKS